MEVFKRYARRRRRVKEPKKNSASAVAVVVEAAMGSLDPSRVCAECRTSQTPLWRSGPNGPRSLCNACGIRYRKRRKAEINGEDKHRKTSASTATRTIKGKNGSMIASLEVVGEELRRRQKEKQERMLLRLLERQKQRSRGLTAAATAAAGRGAGKEEAEAALLLLSLSSSGIFVHPSTG
ncbi:uncharacterized protein [Elaeis guineensis]|uniref:GATA transcription factor 23 n=1 Tax=Elaeis guineensis var. tenera TaxID=51953 RepID=A0A6I9RDA7_ELAGV|nr:GATA transcription factor 23 [Elaeis guineensis]